MKGRLKLVWNTTKKLRAPEGWTCSLREAERVKNRHCSKIETAAGDWGGPGGHQGSAKNSWLCYGHGLCVRVMLNKQAKLGWASDNSRALNPMGPAPCSVEPETSDSVTGYRTRHPSVPTKFGAAGLSCPNLNCTCNCVAIEETEA